MEYGIFSDEGLIEADFYSREEAEKAMADRYTEDGCHVGEVSRDQDGCEAGYEDEEDEAEDE